MHDMHSANDVHVSVEFTTQPDMHLASLPGSVRTLLLVMKSISIFNRDHLCYLVPIDSILVWLFIHAATNLVSFPYSKNGLGTRLLVTSPTLGRPLTRRRAHSRGMRCALNRNVWLRQAMVSVFARLGLFSSRPLAVFGRQLLRQGQERLYSASEGAQKYTKEHFQSVSTCTFCILSFW